MKRYELVITETAAGVMRGAAMRERDNGLWIRHDDADLAALVEAATDAHKILSRMVQSSSGWPAYGVTAKRLFVALAAVAGTTTRGRE